MEAGKVWGWCYSVAKQPKLTSRMYCTCVLSAEKLSLSRTMLEQSTTCCDQVWIKSTVSKVRLAFFMML